MFITSAIILFIIMNHWVGYDDEIVHGDYLLFDAVLMKMVTTFNKDPLLVSHEFCLSWILTLFCLHNNSIFLCLLFFIATIRIIEFVKASGGRLLALFLQDFAFVVSGLCMVSCRWWYILRSSSLNLGPALFLFFLTAKYNALYLSVRSCVHPQPPPLFNAFWLLEKV